jgi:hypothetical protein
MLSRLFKLPNHKRFDYKPRYFDEAKEDLNGRIEQAKKELGQSSSENGTNTHLLRSRMRQRWNRNSYAKGVKSSNIRVVLIVAAIVIFLWWLFK